MNPLVPSSGWRVPALAIVVALIALVGVARLGMVEQPAVAPATTSATMPAASVGATLAAPSATESVLAVIQTPSDLEFAYSPWPDRYADGIPRAIDGQEVVRLNRAIARATAEAGQSEHFLIGGWFSGTGATTSGCSPQGYEPWCRQGGLADKPTLFERDGVEVVGMPAMGPGPVVIATTVKADCHPVSRWTLRRDCQYELRAEQVLWQGDGLTSAEPIAVGPLLSAIGDFVYFDPQPFHARPGCQSVPPQSYAVDYGEVRVVAIFATTADRLAQEAAIEQLAGADRSPGCAKLPLSDDSTRWLSVANVMVRLTDYGGGAAPVVRDLLEALSAPTSW